MAESSTIEWTDATWNPIAGCSLKSPGCTHCYAMPTAYRHELMSAALGRVSPYTGLTRKVNGKAVWTGDMRLVEAALTLPLRWTKPRRIFVNSMSDLFHESVPDDWIDRVFAVMALCPQHTFQVLTKRADRMRAYLTDASFGLRVGGELMRSARGHAGAEAMVIGLTHQLSVQGQPLPNVWLGVSAEDQRRADERVPDLLATPAAVRFVSAEPLLGPIDFHKLPLEADGYRASALFGHEVAGAVGQCIDWVPPLDWIIVGGESGPGARPMHPDWARQIRDACAAAGVAFHFKQHGAWVSTEGWYADHQVSLPIRAWTGTEWTDDGRYADREWVALVGKKAAGRLLDGVEHNGFPEVAR